MTTKVILVLVAIFAGLVVIKIGPVYMGGISVESIVSDLTEEAATKGYARSAIKQRLDKRFDMNNIEGLTPRDVKILVTDDEVSLNASYEKRVSFLFNIDVVVKFDDLSFTAPVK